jgi:deoxyribose-phosphate aldolase
MLQTVWDNKQLVAEIIGFILILFFCWWFFVHNPARIDALEADKAELARQVKNGADAIHLLNNINTGKVAINEQVFRNVSAIRAAAVPRRAVIIRAGLLPAAGVR